MDFYRHNYYKRFYYEIPKNKYDYVCIICKSFIATFEKVPEDLICFPCKEKENK